MDRYIGISNDGGNFKNVIVKIVNRTGDDITVIAESDGTVSHMRIDCLMENFKRIEIQEE